MTNQQIDHHMALHHGVITRAEAISLGATPGQIRARTRSGRWVRVAANVYRTSATPLSWEGWARAMALSIGGVVSHRSALALWSVDGFDRLPKPGEPPATARRPLELTVDERRGRPRVDGPVVVYRSRQFDLIDQTTRRSVPATGLTRSVLDASSVLPRSRIDQLLDAVVRQRLCGYPELEETLRHHSARGRNGCGRLREALEDRSPTARVPDSLFNRRVGQLLTRAGLPDPLYEYEVLGGSGAVLARVDLAYPEHRLAIECDGAAVHMTHGAFVADPRRKNRLAVAGWEVLTFTWPDYVDQPDAIAATVAALLHVRRPIPPPPHEICSKSGQ